MIHLSVRRNTTIIIKLVICCTWINIVRPCGFKIASTLLNITSLFAHSVQGNAEYDSTRDFVKR